MRKRDIPSMQRQLAAHVDFAHRAPDQRVRYAHRATAADLTDKILAERERRQTL